MKFLVATALLLWVAADAYHTSEHKLLGPLFAVGRTYVYNVTMDVSSSIAGISPQVAKSSLTADLYIFAKSEREHLLKMTNVKVSESQKSLPSYSSHIDMRRSKELEDHLSVPITFILEKGQIRSYTLDSRETLESKKIKKSILRMIELYVDENSVQEMESHPLGELPVRYNVSRNSPAGEYQSHYIITASPYPEFPYETNVFNISRSDNFENIRYPAHKFHHNFVKQGCSEVCKNEWEDNKYGAGCPNGYEPHQSLTKMYYNHHHHLAMNGGVMVPEIIETTETHVASLYDQDMKVVIRNIMRQKKVSNDRIEEPHEQQTYTDLDDWTAEYNEKEIDDLCHYPSPREAIESIKKLLNELTEIVVKADLSDRKSTLVGEKLVLLQKALSLLTETDFEKIEEIIPRLSTLEQATDSDKIKRQIWTNILPVVGTEPSVIYITKYIQRKVPNELTVFEAKDILEALPQNIHAPSEKIVRHLMKLFELRDVYQYNMLHSAVHITVARIINRLCPVEENLEEQKFTPLMTDYRRAFRMLNRETQQSSAYPGSKCPTSLVKEVVETIYGKLRSTKSRPQKAIYIQTLAHISSWESVKYLTNYAYGFAEDLRPFTPSEVLFFRTMTIHALHNTVRKYPQQVLDIIVPIYFNRTEEPKLRTAAFGLILRAQPSLELLEHIATDTWSEVSKEVGSFVTSSLETYGNSSLPCDQLTARRIQKVITQAKRFDIGVQHAKNYLFNYFDDTRDYGLDGRLEYTPSNESFIPSSMYHAYSYTLGGLRDVFFQNALNIQGLTFEKLVKKLRLEDMFGIKTGKPIPSNIESEIFGKMILNEKVPEKLRMTFFRRVFYESAFYYTENLERDLAPLRTHLNKYFKTSNGIKGVYVKMMIPSTQHTVAVAKSLPYPVEFEMKYPFLVALRVKSHQRGNLSPKKLHLSINLSTYVSRMHNLHMKMLRDCKEVGTYYEGKMGLAIPFEIKLNIESYDEVKVQYKINDLPKRVIFAREEAGTYDGKKELEILPHMIERDTIETIPELFRREQELSVIGLPPVRIAVHSEDLTLGPNFPRTMSDAFDWIVTKSWNAGWRQRSMNVTLNTDSAFWPANTEVTLNFSYNKTHNVPLEASMVKSQQTGDREHWSNLQTSEDQEHWSNIQSSEDREQWSNLQASEDREHWSNIQARESDKMTEEDLVQEMNIRDTVDSRRSSEYIAAGRKLYQKLASSYPHMQHTFEIQMETTPVNNKASIRVEYNHTMGRHLHIFHVDADCKLKRMPVRFEVSADHIIGFWKRPNEFKFDDRSFTQQKGAFLSAISLRNAKPFDNVDILVAGAMKRDPVSEILNKWLVSNVNERDLYPECFEICKRDVQRGKSLSEECVRCIRDMSIYNKYKIIATWSKAKLPSFVPLIFKRIELETRRAAWGHLELSDKKGIENALDVEVTYIDQMTDTPLVDIVLQKPNELVKYSKLDAGLWQPLSSIHTVFDTYVRDATNYTYPATCHVMENYLTTYDLKTYKLNTNKCQYLVSSHCAKNKMFAVLAKVLSPREGTKEITLHVAQHKLVLSPGSGDAYRVIFNGQEKTLKVWKPLMLGDEYTEILVVKNTASGDKFVEVYVDVLGLKLTYDGKNIKVQVDPRFKGELCGLCSEYDGEITREYRAPDQCLYSDLEDFTKRSIVNPRECGVNPQPTHKHICPSMERRIQSSEGEIVMRNKVEYKRNEICFSTMPVPMCSEEAEPEETEEMEVGFHCLPRNDITAQEMVAEARIRPLDVMRSKSVDYTETVPVAKSC